VGPLLAISIVVVADIDTGMAVAVTQIGSPTITAAGHHHGLVPFGTTTRVGRMMSTVFIMVLLVLVLVLPMLVC
jgi:hypothetical protein